MGDATTIAITTSLMKSAESNAVILVADAPSTLRMPISLVRCTVSSDIKPKRPRQLIVHW